MTADHWAWVLMPSFSVAFIGYLLGAILGRWFGFPSAKLVLASLGLTVGIWPSLKIYAALSSLRAKARIDLQASTVEVIEVSDPVVVAQEEYNDEGPILYLDIGGGKILFVWGQWLFDPHVFPASAWHHSERRDGNYELLFPTSRFVLHRSASLGRVLRVDLSGTPVKPVRTIPSSSIPLSGHCESEILDGSLENLPEAMERLKKG